MSKRKEKPKVGRPPKPSGEKQSGLVMVRLTPAEKARLEAEAKAKGISMAKVLLDAWHKGRK